MSFGPRRGENIPLKAAVLIVLGLSVGIADAFFLRPVNTKAADQTPIDEVLAGLGNKSKTPTPPVDVVVEDGGTTPPVPPVQTGGTPDAPTPDDNKLVDPVTTTGNNSSGQQQATNTGTEQSKDDSSSDAAPMKKNHITIEQAYTLYESDPRGETAQVIFIDARAMSKYEEGHVAGSVPMGLEAFQGGGDPPQMTMLRGMNPTAIFVVYCLGGECHESEEVALLMNNSGFPTTYIMHDGLPAWQAAGHPVEQGRHPMHDAYGFR